MNTLDVFLLALLVLAGFSGYRRGLALQAFSFGGLLIGLGLGAVTAPWFAGLVESRSAKAGVALLTLVVLGGAGDAVGWVIGSRLRERARSTRFGPADAVAGSAVAVVASLLAIWFIALNLVNGPFSGVANEIRGSAVVRSIDAALPEPPSLLSQVQRFFNRFGFPDVFTGIPPLPADPVRPPTPQEARLVFDSARDNVVRVIGEACGHVQEGSGFVAADGYVVTNAHVVAGVGQPHVQTRVEGSQRSDPVSPVVFDPDTDVAVLYVPDGTGPGLSLSSGTVERGASGAILGYPNGGPLTGSSAAVLRAFDPVGRDIYGSSTVQRSVLELQAEVRPGDSGGPFVLSDGTVAGVVFAASTTDDHVGYAIDASEVRPSLRRAIGRTAPVGTGGCIR